MNVNRWAEGPLPLVGDGRDGKKTAPVETGAAKGWDGLPLRCAVGGVLKCRTQAEETSDPAG